jgi:hypothetical protein
MTHSNNVHLENQIAYKMLCETIHNPKIKSVLKNISNKVLNNILSVLSEKIHASNISSLDDLPLFIQKSIKILALQNIDAEKPFGGVLNGFLKPEEITSKLNNIKQLLEQFANVLTHVDEISHVQQVLKLLKTIADLSFCYFEYFDEQHSAEFNRIKDMIWLTPEECDGRIMRAEVKQEPQLAMTYGISAEEKVDIVPADQKKGMNSGKALFFGASMDIRIKIIVNKHDLLLEKIQKNKMAEKNDENKLFIEKELAALEKEYLPILNKMQYYKIPLQKESRQPLNSYSKKYETTFEKQARDSKKNIQLPLVANISRSTARTLITLQDLLAFQNNNERVDLETAQIFANCIMSFYVWGGHHSFTEVGEIYNRWLDYNVLKDPSFFNDLDGTNDKFYLEKKLPYYVFGDYSSFLHRDYAASLCHEGEADKLDTSLKSVKF